MHNSIVKIIDVNVNEIIPNRFQPRRQFDEDEIIELSESIRKYGLIQPLVVRPTGDKYEIIAGERRYKASVLAGLEYVPVIVKNLTDKDSAELAIIENIQRRNLSAIEEALSYKKVLDMGYLTQEDLATKIGKSQSTIANKIRLLNLSDEVQEALLENKISERHARSLLRLTTESEQNDMLQRIINERLTVRKTDEEIDKKIKGLESGEINMNQETGNMEMPTMESLSVSPSVSDVPTFDMFGTNNNVAGDVQPMGTAPQPEFIMPQIPEAPSVSEVAPTPIQPAAPQPEFVMPQIPEAPSVSEVAPTPVQPEPAPQPEFVMPQIPEAPIAPGVVPTPVQPEPAPQPEFVMPQIPEAPVAPGVAPTPVQPEPAPQPEFVMPQIPEAPIAPGVAPTPVQPEPAPQPEFVMPQIPEAPSAPGVAEVPVTSPIIEQPEPAPQPEFVMPQVPETPVVPQEEIKPQVSDTIEETSLANEPIIVTDYSKQYDPVMPNAPQPVEKVEFKEVIDAIRECSSKIEKFGYVIDVEEYDLANLYQVVFKVEK